VTHASLIFVGWRAMHDSPMRRWRTLITSPLEWQMTAVPVAHPALPVVAEHGGHAASRAQTVAVIDTREQNSCSFARSP
jgi:hypothetical protein